MRQSVLIACIALPLGMAATAQPSAPAFAAPHVGSAVKLMEEHRFSEAAAEFELALAADPNNDEIRIQYATCLFVEERNEEARKEFEIERQRLGDRPGLNYYLGRLDIRAGDFAVAIRKLAPLESNPAFPKDSFYLGLAYLSAGQPERALECFEHAARDNPRDSEVHYRLARAYSMANRTEEAEREYELYRQWRETQRFAEQHGSECSEALRSQPIEEARTVCQRLADANDPRRLVLLGELYAENEAFAAAVEPLQRATQLEPESFEAWQYLGLSLFRLQRYQEALPPLRKAASLNPQFLSSLTLLASALHAAGDDAAAIPVLERAHRLNPADTKVNSALEQLRSTRKR